MSFRNELLPHYEAHCSTSVLNPIETMLLLRQLRPEQVASLSPPAVAQMVHAFRLKAEQLVFANPLLSNALGHGALNGAHSPERLSPAVGRGK